MRISTNQVSCGTQAEKVGNPKTIGKTLKEINEI
jgi:hypothetical protein